MSKLRKLFKSLKIALCRHIGLFDGGDFSMLYDVREHQLIGYMISKRCPKCGYRWYDPELWARTIPVRVTMRKAD